MFSTLTQWCPLPPGPKKIKKAAISFTITTFISVCLPQMSRHAMVWLHTKSVPEEKRKQKQGNWDHCLEIAYQPQPCQHQVTLGSRHADGTFPAVVARAVLVQYTAAFTAVLPLGPAHRDREVSYQKMEMCLDSSFQSNQLVKFIFVASKTLNLFKMYVKMTQYGNNNLQHRKMLTAKTA